MLAERRADDKGEHALPRRVDAHGLGGDLVRPNGSERAPECGDGDIPEAMAIVMIAVAKIQKVS